MTKSRVQGWKYNSKQHKVHVNLIFISLLLYTKTKCTSPSLYLSFTTYTSQLSAAVAAPAAVPAVRPRARAQRSRVERRDAVCARGAARATIACSGRDSRDTGSAAHGRTRSADGASKSCGRRNGTGSVCRRKSRAVSRVGVDSDLKNGRRLSPHT